MTTGIIIQARMSSTRLPKKIMLPLAGRSVLWHVFANCSKTKADKVIIATTTNPADNPIEDFCKKEDILFYRGSEEDVLDRFYQCAKLFKLDTIIRITSDCPLTDPDLINQGLEIFNSKNVDYLNNISLRSYPRGVDFEIFKFSALEKDHQLAKEKHEREHVTPFIYNHTELFTIHHTLAEGKLKRPDMRLCIDTKEDYELLQTIFNKLYKGQPIPIQEVISFLADKPELVAMNQASEKEHLERSKALKQKFVEEGKS